MTNRTTAWRATAVTGLLLLALAMSASAVEYTLRAEASTLTMPDGRVVPVWGFALDGGAATVPGPMLTVPANDSTLVIHLENRLSVPVSLVIPGQTISPVPVMNPAAPYPQFAGRVRSFTTETAPGATVTYTWTGFRPGTFLYESGTHSSQQVQMGLYGGVTRDQAPPAGGVRTAYPGVQFDSEVTLLYSEIDADYHDAVAAGDYGPEADKSIHSIIDYQPDYFLVNGVPYTDGAAPMAAGAAGDRILVRLLNAGFHSHAPNILGMYATVVAEDGYPYLHMPERYSVTLEAMKTKDILLEPSSAGTIPLYDRGLNLTNAAAVPGGLYTFLEVAAP